MEDKGYLVLFLLFIVFVAGFLFGLNKGLTFEHSDCAVVTKVEKSNSSSIQYRYTTSQFDFESDSIYNIGDTIVICRKSVTY